MTFSGKHLTKADEARRSAIHAGNCCACEQLGLDITDSGVVEFHHTAGKKRHDLTVGLCCFHHRGVPWPGRSLAWCRENLGPALSEGSKPFVAKFGTGAALLAVQDEMFAKQRDEAA